jgi:isocitrate/isopropylmalate dehydrogenase
MTYKLTSLATVFNNIEPFVIESERENLIQFKVDPLVLSCCQYRHSDPKTEDYNPTAATASISNNPDYLYTKVTQADYDLAEKIRKYYWGKIAFAKLRGSQMSKFRQDLSEFINIKWDESVKISDKFAGMLYKLPYFYEHDLLLVSEVFETEYQEIKKPQESWEEVTLTYIRSLDERQKRNPSIKYWFKDEFDNKFCVSVEKMNSLIPSWERFIEKPITIKGKYIERAYDTLHFYRVNPGWKIVG